MFGVKQCKSDKRISAVDVEQLMVCDSCHAESLIKPSEIILGNFRYWFKCSKCGACTRVRLSELPQSFSRYVGVSKM